MGFWINNFIGLEGKSKRANRFILNFYYFPSAEEEPKSIKVFLKQNVKIPSCFLKYENLEKIIKRVEKLATKLRKYVFNDYYVLEVELPYEKNNIKELPDVFQKGSYVKIFKYRGFYPERKVSLDAKVKKIFEEISKFEKKEGENKENSAREIDFLLKQINKENKFYFNVETKNYEVELNSLDGIFFEEKFLTEKDFSLARKLYLDLEKPLWKKEEEKELIKKRKELLRKLSKEKNAENTKSIKREIEEIEKKLTINTKFGTIKLYEDLFDAKISFVSTIWENINGRTIKELYVWDPLSDINEEYVNGFFIKKFKTEKELIEALTTSIKNRKPLVCIGHNEAYDITQLRFASEETRAGKFDIAVKDIVPRRDFVRDFLQRLREDLIYIDTLWLNRIFFPFLSFRSLKRSLKLEDVAKFHGIPFEKKIKHEELRDYEIKRLAGNETERKEAFRELADYTTKDIEIIYEISKKIPFSLLVKLKNVMPYLTFTELAFSTSCIKKYFEKKHFDLFHNLEYYGKKQKKREEKLQLFKRVFKRKKKELLEWAGIQVEKENYDGAYEIYIPFEEFILDCIFRACPEFEKIYKSFENKETNKVKENIEKFGFLQYMKVLAQQILTDYYWVRKCEKEAKKFLGKIPLFALQQENSNLSILEKKARKNGLERELRNSFSTLDYSLECFYDLYNFLDAKTKKELKNKPEIEALFMLYRKKELGLKEKKEKLLRTFVGSFKKFLETSEMLVEKMKIPKEIFYALYYQEKSKKEKKRFEKKYNLKVEELTRKIAISYKNLKRELEFLGKVVGVRGDLLFLKPYDGKEIEKSKFFYIIRKF
ncbi:MAG: hypothetical protein NZ889_00310 [Candidatus Pacearchaeota archaeon]|nr:hypothetical protein [Candidatus Pacearchaeota archaeon]